MVNQQGHIGQTDLAFRIAIDIGLLTIGEYRPRYVQVVDQKAQVGQRDLVLPVTVHIADRPHTIAAECRGPGLPLAGRQRSRRRQDGCHSQPRDYSHAHPTFVSGSCLSSPRRHDAYTSRLFKPSVRRTTCHPGTIPCKNSENGDD